MEPILEIKDLNISFSMYQTGVEKANVETIRSINLRLFSGEIVAIVGSSGSGKSLLASAVMGILPNNAQVEGSIVYKGEELTKKRQEQLRGSEIALIPQSVDYLDPLMQVKNQVIGKKGSKEDLKALFKRYDLDECVEKLYPFELSGGMARRVLIATALTIHPELIIADEPTPGLTVELAMETLKHFDELAKSGTAILLITHDIDLALSVASRVAVFYAGMTVEVSPVKDFGQGGEALRHPYSKALVRALPQNDFTPISGSQPAVDSLSEGCPFTDRCLLMTEECNEKLTMRNLRGGEVLCVHAT